MHGHAHEHRRPSRRSLLANVLVSAVTAAIVAGGPAVAATVVSYATSADKVDGRHAVSSAASVSKRKGKLVATSGTTGLLPNNIIAKAPNANLLDGIDSSDLVIDRDAAGGELSGIYPDPEIAAGVLDQSNFGILPAARAHLSAAAQSIPNDTYTIVNFDADLFDTASVHDEVAAQDKMTAPTSGIYQVSAGVAWDASGTGVRELTLMSDAGIFDTQVAAVSASGLSGTTTYQNVTTTVALDAGEDVWVYALQNSGAPLDLLSSSSNTWFEMHWIAPPVAAG